MFIPLKRSQGNNLKLKFFKHEIHKFTHKMVTDISNYGDKHQLRHLVDEHQV